MLCNILHNSKIKCYNFRTITFNNNIHTRKIRPVRCASGNLTSSSFVRLVRNEAVKHNVLLATRSFDNAATAIKAKTNIISIFFKII